MRRKAVRIGKRIAILILAIAALLAIVVFFYMKKAVFGKAPAGARLAKMQQSPHFKNGSFQNLSPTPQLAEGYNIAGVTYDRFFKKAARRTPVDTIPSVKTDLRSLPADANVLVWFGHSSYYIQVDGKRILVDPVFSGNASPVRGTVPAFGGTDIYTAADFPDIDYLFISHDHYDHLDYETLLALRPKIKKVVCGLGVGAHFEHWGYAPDAILEKDWNEKAVSDSGFTAYALPARHFSGRSFSTNNTLWLSYLLQTPTLKIYIGGDSHFAEIGNRFGPIDLAILDNGQYNVAWRNIHTLPEEVLKAAQDLKAKRLFPVHSSKFALANHPWDGPLSKITELNKAAQNIPLVTPVIGETVYLNDSSQHFRQWWAGLK